MVRDPFLGLLVTILHAGTALKGEPSRDPEACRMDFNWWFHVGYYDKPLNKWELMCPNYFHMHLHNAKGFRTRIYAIFREFHWIGDDTPS